MRAGKIPSEERSPIPSPDPQPRRPDVELLIYSHYFAPSIGGTETIVQALGSGLATLRGSDRSAEFSITLATQMGQGDFDDSKLPFKIVRQPGFWKLLRLVRSARVVHIAGPSFSPMLLAWILRRPFFVEHHTYQAICPNGLLIHQPDRAICPGHFQLGNYRECRKCEAVENSRPRAFLKVLLAFPRRALMRRAAANIAVSEHVKARIGAPRSTVIYHGVENVESVAQTNAGKICFGFVGRFVPEKGIPIFLEALATLKKEGYVFNAKLIGDGPERSKLERQIADLNLSTVVKITGYLSGEALSAAVADVSVIVMPSIWEETAGLAAMAQMMRGRLVVCSQVGGLAEIVGEAGLTFRSNDAKELSEKLRQVLTVPLIIASLGGKARRHALERYSLEKMVAEHYELYSNLQGK